MLSLPASYLGVGWGGDFQQKEVAYTLCKVQ